MRVTVPVTVFCDASCRPGLPVAAFGLLFEALPGPFAAPAGVLERYVIEAEEAHSRPPAVVAASGLVRAVDPTSAEIMAVSAGLEVLAGLPGRRRIVLYCDNLDVVRWMGGSQADLHGCYDRYRALVEHALRQGPGHEWRVEKIAAHIGLPGNETADLIARSRLDRLGPPAGVGGRSR